MSALAEATPTTMPEPIVFTDSAAAKVAAPALLWQLLVD